jgi:hypothetical protein
MRAHGVLVTEFVAWLQLHVLEGQSGEHGQMIEILCGVGVFVLLILFLLQMSLRSVQFSAETSPFSKMNCAFYHDSNLDAIDFTRVTDRIIADWG